MPRGAAFAPLGNIGLVYELSASGAVDASFQVPEEAVKTILPSTIRLFRYDDKEESWGEIAKSHFDAEPSVLVGKDLKPGLYTAFGWSANPAENALQRMIFDFEHGYSASLKDSSAAGAQVVDVEMLRLEILLAWIFIEVNLTRTACEALDNPGCPLFCRRLASHHRKFSSCPQDTASGMTCEAPNCCSCVTRNIREGAYVPESIFEAVPPLCRTPGQCPICPNGISCPTFSDFDINIIAPILPVPDYEVFSKIGLGGIIQDTVLRDSLNGLVEKITGQEYPIPPPWGS